MTDDHIDTARERAGLKEMRQGGWGFPKIEELLTMSGCYLDALDAKDAEIERLRAALHYYAEQFCEMGSDWEGCGKLTEEQCGGCRARTALNPEGEA